MKRIFINPIIILIIILLFLSIPSFMLYSMGSKVKDVQAKLDECNKKSQALESENSQLKTQNSDLQSRIDSLNVQKEELEKRIAELESQIAEKEIEIETLEKEALEPTIVSKTVEEKIQEQEAQIQELKIKREQLESNLQQINKELAQLKSTNQNLLKEKDQLQAQVKNISKEKEVLEMKYRETVSEKEEAERALVAFESIQKESLMLMDLALERVYDSMSEEIKAGQVKVFKGRLGIIMDVVSEPMFDEGGVKLNKTGKDTLKKIAQLLNELDGYFIGVIGNADNKPIVGSSLRKLFPTNWELSAYRGAVAVRYLLDNSNIKPSKMIAMGLGEYQPIDDNETEEGRGNNRRVDIVLLPVDVLAAVVVGAEIK